MLAVVDHMRLGYACRLAQIPPPRQDFCVLPGVELNVRLAPPLHTMRVHILAVFPSTKTLGELERLFPTTLPDDAHRTGDEEILVRTLQELTDTIRACGGLSIAAHIDSDAGVRLLFRQTGRETLSVFDPEGRLGIAGEREISESFKGFLIEAKLDGVEVRRAEDRSHYSWRTETTAGEVHHVPVFLTTDAYSIEQMQRQDQITYVKMAEVSWLGLSDAVKFPSTRIRFSIDRDPAAQILGLEILSPSSQGFFPHLVAGFVENLNCIIGPRGSGKSTLIDAIRYVLGYNRTLGQLDSPDLQKAILDRQEKTLTESIIRLVYRLADGRRHVLEATYDPRSDYTTKVFDLDGQPVLVDDVEASGLYPVRLFGWSEIETLGRVESRQRDLLDQLVEDLPPLLESKRSALIALSQNRELILQAAASLRDILSRNDSLIRRHREFSAEFAKLNTEEVQGLFQALDEHRERQHLLDRVRARLAEFQTQLDNLVSPQLLDDAGDLISPGSPLHEWWIGLSRDPLRIEQTERHIAEALSSAREAVASLLARLDTVNHDLAEAAAALAQRIRDTTSADPSTQVLADLRSQAKERLDRVNALRQEYEESLRSLRDIMNARNNELVPTLVSVHSRTSRSRSLKKDHIDAQLGEFRTDEMTISVELLPDGDRSTMENVLSRSAILGRAQRNYRARSWPQLLTRTFTPPGLARALLEADAVSLQLTAEYGGTTCQITEEEVARVVQASAVFSEDESAGVILVNTEALEEILNLQETDWDDTERILRNGNSVETASPGQRSSAMLPLIALAETVPLIIDQPEDNLDNRLVGRILVDILAKLKERRQIIVSTHNPNIVVLGDSEQVLVLDAVSDSEGKAESPQASVDHPFIVGRVIDLLEGGKEAVETRSRRYAMP
jgi:DNA repair ATPase RecN